MKIMLIADFYPPFTGGLEKHVETLAKNLAKTNEVVVCTISNKSTDLVNVENGVKIYRLNGVVQKIPFLFKDSTKKFHPPCKDILLSKKISKIIEDERPEVVHTHGWILFSVIPLKKKFNFKLIHTIHDYGLICPTRSLMNFGKVCSNPLTKKCIKCGISQYGRLKSWTCFVSLKNQRDNLNLVDKYFAVSPFVKDIYSKRINPNKIEIVPNFYDDSEIKKYKDFNSKKLPQRFVLFVGAMTPYKGAKELIQAFRKIKNKNNTKLVIFTTKNPEISIKDRKEILIFENASRENILEAYRKCLFVVIPSKWPDPCPTVAFEAMANKKTILTSNLGGLAWIVTNKTGVVIKTIDDLKEKLEFLIRKKKNLNNYEGLGYKRYIKQFKMDRVITKILEEYKK